MSDTPTAMGDGTTPSAMRDTPTAMPAPATPRYLPQNAYRIDPDNPPPRVVDVRPTRRPRNPWDRMPEESIQAFRAFEFYRDMDPIERALKPMATVDITKLHKGETIRKRMFSWGSILRWNKQFRWADRARAFDDEVARKRALKVMHEQEQMQERHARIALSMQAKVADRLNTMDSSELGRRDIDRWAEKAVRMERQARGLDRIGQRGNAPGVNVNIGIGGPPREPEVEPDTPIGTYLTQHPGELAGAIGSIESLLAFAREREGGNVSGEVDFEPAASVSGEVETAPAPEDFGRGESGSGWGEGSDDASREGPGV